jgi:hypothetical protein
VRGGVGPRPRVAHVVKCRKKIALDALLGLLEAGGGRCRGPAAGGEARHGAREVGPCDPITQTLNLEALNPAGKHGTVRGMEGGPWFRVDGGFGVGV